MGINLFKVFTVDDETVMYNGLINLIDWESLGCVVCGSQTNGERGLESILELKPDIVISDICMPEMDGLEMVKHVKEALPHCKVIMVTAYREFNYAHDAIKLGAFDFILKPFKIDAITSSVKRAVTQLKFQLTKDEEFSKLRNYYEKSMPVLKEKCLFDLLVNGFSTKDNEEQLLSYGLEIHGFVLVTCRLSELKCAQEDESIYRLGVVKTFLDMFSQKYKVEKVSINSKLCSFLFCFEGCEKNLINHRFYHDIDDIVKLIFECFQIQITAGISSWGHGANNLFAKYQESIYALEQIEGDEQSIILFEDLQHLYKDSSVSYFETLQTQLVGTIQLGKTDKTQELLQEGLEYIQVCTTLNEELIADFFTTTYKKIQYIEKSLKHLIQNSFDEKRAEEDFIFENLQFAYDRLSFYANKVSREIQGFNTCKTNDIVLNAVKYMRENYQNSITLNHVADEVHVSLYYLSRLFKKQYNQTFSEYLINMRIHYAKEYMRNTQYKAYEIGELVGISDPHYFSKCFKRCTGQTPTAYRENILTGKI